MTAPRRTSIETLTCLVANVCLTGAVIAMFGLGVAWLWVVFLGFPRFAQANPADYLDTLRESAVWALGVAIVSWCVERRYRSAATVQSQD